MSTFVPPLFKNFGKNLKDLLEKKFEFNREIKFKTTTLNGVTFESTGRVGKAGDFAGLLKTTTKRADLGTIETELETEGKAKVSFEADKLASNTVVKLTGDQSMTATLDVSYRNSHFADNLILTSNKSGSNLEGSAVVGVDGLSVGVQGKYDFSGQGDIADFNVGAELTQPDFTITARTADKTDKIRLGYIHSVNADLTVGGQYEINTASVSVVTAQLLTVSTSYAVNRDTIVKGKFDSRGIVTGALEQRLYNPKLKYNLAAEFNSRQSVVPDKIGVSVVLGEN